MEDVPVAGVVGADEVASGEVCAPHFAQCIRLEGQYERPVNSEILLLESKETIWGFAMSTPKSVKL
jgi:hypothetical protein